MMRFLRENAELITSICVVLSLVLGGALLYLKNRSEAPVEPVTTVSAPQAAAPSTATQPAAELPVSTTDSNTK